MHPGLILDSVYPIDVASFGAARKHRETVHGKRIIGFAGKLISRKGVDELLRALQLIADDDTWEARVIGDGQEKEGLLALSESLGIAKRVDFRGFRNVSEMPDELADCDIVVVPSVQDNRGMIAAEAMAAGAAVIVSSNTGIWGRGDVIEDGVTGRVYRSGDHAELATIVRHLLKSPATLASLQREGAIRAEKHGPKAFTVALERAALTITTND
jgi:glycosyltransferase involved in cell wall biosynthesis